MNYQQCRNTLNEEAPQQIGRRFSVDLDQAYFGLECGRRFLEGRCHCPARTAPGCPEVDQQWNVTVVSVLFEASRVVQIEWSTLEQQLSAPPALPGLWEPLTRHAIGGVAVWANNVKRPQHAGFLRRENLKMKVLGERVPRRISSCEPPRFREKSWTFRAEHRPFEPCLDRAVAVCAEASTNPDDGHVRVAGLDASLSVKTRVRRVVVQIELARIVAAEASTAFKTVANVAGWPQIMTSVRSLEELTPGPTKVGTRLRENRTLFGRDTTLELEVATMERPHRFRLLVQHPDLRHELDYLIDAVYGGGCRIMLVFRSRHATAAGRALQPLATPFMAIGLRDEFERDQTWPLRSRIRQAPKLDTDVSSL